MYSAYRGSFGEGDEVFERENVREYVLWMRASVCMCVYMCVCVVCVLVHR